MDSLVYGLLALFAVALIYFNVVASVMLCQEKLSTATQKAAKLAFIWMLPILGFLLALRFSRQVFENPLHDTLIPRFLGHWIYDQSSYQPNQNRDDNDLKTVHGVSTYDHGSQDR